MKKKFSEYLISENKIEIDLETIGKTVNVLNDHADIYYKFLESLRKELRKSTPSDFYDNLNKISHKELFFNFPRIYKDKLSFNHQLETLVDNHIKSMRRLEAEYQKLYNKERNK